MTPAGEARYEFRSFEDAALSYVERLRGAAVRTEQLEQQVAYVVSRLNIDANVKIVERRIEVKLLLARDGLLEQWTPSISQEWLSGQEFADHVAAPLGVDFDVPRTSTVGADELVALAAEHPALAVVEVSKARTRFHFEHGLGEHVALRLADRSAQSIAVESARLEAAEHLVSAFGLAALVNESYPGFLQRIAFATAATAGPR